MTKITNHVQQIKSKQLQGRLGYPDTYGEYILGYGQIGEHCKINGVYQHRHTKRGIICIRENFMTPADPRDPKVLANRQKFGDAVRAWQQLTAEQKIEWRKKRGNRCMTGFNFFIKKYMLGAIPNNG